MSLYLGNDLIAPNQSNAANKSLSNLDATGQAVIDGKADVDLTNVTDVANIKMAHNAMPSQTSIELAVGASGSTYTAPADGWFYASGNWFGSGSGFALTFDVDNKSYGAMGVTGMSGPSYGKALCPVSKNDIVRFTYSTVTVTGLRFLYANGSESEAQ